MFVLFLTVIGYWVALGAAVASMMILCLYFAKTCECLVDFFFTK